MALGCLAIAAAGDGRAPLFAAHVSWTYQSSDTTPQGLRSASVYPSGTFTNGAGAIITRDRVSRTTDATGQLIISNIYGGDYRGELQGTFTVTTNWYRFPVTNGLINAADYITAPTNGNTGYRAYTTAESDGRFLRAGVSGFDAGNVTNISVGASAATTNGFYPINVSGAGQAGVNGLYYLVATNAGVANAGWAKFTNSAGYNLFLNGEDELDFVDPPVWTLDDPSTNNCLYDNLGRSSPFIGWEPSGIFGIAGPLMPPVVVSDLSYATNMGMALLQRTNATIYLDPIGGDDLLGVRGGRAFKTLAAAQYHQAIGDTWVFAPGNYFCGMTWHLTNATIIAHGATIYFDALHAVEPVGTFDSYGGAILNTNVQATQCVMVSGVTNHFGSFGTRYLGASDTFAGASADNMLFDFVGGEVGTYWDGTTISGSTTTNARMSFVGVTFHWYYNSNAIFAMNSSAQAKPLLLQFGSNTISGCTVIVENGATNTANNGAILASGGVSFISGTSIYIGTNNIKKIVQAGAGGVLNVSGHPFRESETSGTINWMGDATNSFLVGGFMSASAGGDRRWTLDGSAFTNLNASELRSGTVPTARLGSGSATANTLLHGNSAWSAVVEADQSLSDVTTANASNSRHGYMAKLDGVATHYFDGNGAQSSITNIYEFCLSDETTAITTGTAKVSWRAPHAMTLKDCRASLSTTSSSGIPTVNIKEGGTTIFSTKLTIDANELTSTTAATPFVFSDTALADDALITFDIDVAGTGATGLKVKLYYTR